MKKKQLIIITGILILGAFSIGKHLLYLKYTTFITSYINDGVDSPYKSQVSEIRTNLPLPTGVQLEKEVFRNIDLLEDPTRDSCSNTGYNFLAVYKTDLTDSEIRNFYEKEVKKLQKKSNRTFKEIDSDGSLSYVQANNKTITRIAISTGDIDHSGYLASKPVANILKDIDTVASKIKKDGKNSYLVSIEAVSCENWY